MHYIINQDSLKLRNNCDFKNCKDTLIYQSELNHERFSYFSVFLVNLRSDTLKNKYKRDETDGRYTDVKISEDSISSKNISLVRYQNETIEKLIDKVDLLIPDIEDRLYGYKYQKEK